MLVSFTMPANGSGIAEGGDFQHKSSLEILMLNLAQMPNRSRLAPLLAIPCYRAFCYSSMSSKVNSLLVLLIEIRLKVGA